MRQMTGIVVGHGRAEVILRTRTLSSLDRFDRRGQYGKFASLLRHQQRTEVSYARRNFTGLRRQRRIILQQFAILRDDSSASRGSRYDGSGATAGEFGDIGARQLPRAFKIAVMN